MAHAAGVGYNEQGRIARQKASSFQPGRQRSQTEVFKGGFLAGAKQAQQSSSQQPDNSGSGDSAGPAFSLPDFSGAGDKVLLVAAVLIIGLAFYGKLVKPINLNLAGFAGQPSTGVQSYIDQQNRKVSLISDTMPGRILRTNPSKLGGS